MAGDADIQALNRTLKEINTNLHRLSRAADASTLALVELARMLTEDREEKEMVDG